LSDGAVSDLRRCVMRKLAWTLILLALLPIGGAFAEDFKIAESAFKSTVPNSRTKLVDRKTAVAEMGDRGTGRAVETLLWGVGAVDERLEKDLEERARLDRLYEPFNTPKEWQKYENPEKKKEELAAAMAEVDERILDHEAVLEVLLRELRRQTQDEAIDAMSGSAGFRSKNWRVRAYVGDALAGRRSVPSSVPMKLLKDSDARVRSIVAGGFVRRKNDGEGGPDEVVHALTLEMGKILLKENAWQVRAAMVHTLRKLGSKKAIRFLVEALGKETGRLLEDINEALKDLTGRTSSRTTGPGSAGTTRTRPRSREARTSRGRRRTPAGRSAMAPSSTGWRPTRSGSSTSSTAAAPWPTRWEAPPWSPAATTTTASPDRRSISRSAS
jgi:hypothetical protein